MTAIQPSIRRDAASGLVAITIPWLESDEEDMAWFTLSLDALDTAGARARLTNDPARRVIAFERTGEESDRFVQHLATALGVELATDTRMAEHAAISVAEDLTTDDDIDALQVVYALAYGEGHEAQLVIDLDEETVLLALPSTDGTAVMAHLTA